MISNEFVSSSYIAYKLKKVIHQVFTIFYVFSIGAIVNPLVTSCWWYSSACSKGPLHTFAEPSLSTSSASNHDFFSLIPGIMLTRQFATCSNVLKLSSRTIILASGYFLLVVFGSTTEVVKLSKFSYKNISRNIVVLARLFSIFINSMLQQRKFKVITHGKTLNSCYV